MTAKQIEKKVAKIAAKSKYKQAHILLTFREDYPDASSCDLLLEIENGYSDVFALPDKIESDALAEIDPILCGAGYCGAGCDGTPTGMAYFYNKRK